MPVEQPIPVFRQIQNIVTRFAVWLAFMPVLWLFGCAEPPPVDQDKPEKVFGEVTQDIGEGVAGEAEADLQVKPGVTSPITAPLGAYGFASSEIAKQTVKRALDMYRAETGEYPKSHDEFMENVIRRQNISLPKLPGGRKYKYQVDEQRLIVVEADQ